ncbi:2-oxo-4-hydroxy-4-carboxy-5-ureidoimidazoline decarboxylase [Paenibacillus sp. Marseille-Q4541]|uniref:2-oxo-4-hydroxy-4-carboxy-5-ureidoimidazoline decarboxylase n=1 Tax=Paenibacillus sp. Marseille-Q4541 TaxID=2831522 RepID=UPI00201988E3|nr:2-oxo-4-hydroxy-4-carboxy-5-ureidoimidazoline decarboxylase [Paenibacillus sp. Marseille-Q4541]
MGDINSFAKEEYVISFGTLFEHSPWVAEVTYTKRPFSSLAQMHELMKEVVEKAEYESKLTLLRHHPDLGSRLTMSEHSVNEQKGAGLDALSVEQRQELAELNMRYTVKFDFPFIIAVKGRSAEDIVQAMKERLEHVRNDEFRTALEEVYLISWYRLESWIEQNMAEETV